MVRPGGLARRRGTAVSGASDAAVAGPAKATPATGPVDALSIEHIVGTEPSREFRLDPRGRSVAFTQEAGGARQLFTLPLRGGPASQITALWWNPRAARAVSGSSGTTARSRLAAPLSTWRLSWPPR